MKYQNLEKNLQKYTKEQLINLIIQLFEEVERTDNGRKL